MSARRYYCRECEVSLSATREEALAEIANGHTLFTDPAPMPVADAEADAATLRAVLVAGPKPKYLFADPLDNAGRYGSEAIVILVTPATERSVFADALAASSAEVAAREAFKVCPGLRS